jgi:serine protease Do
VAFSRSNEPTQPTEVPHETDLTLQAPLGISGTIIPQVYQRYYHLPNGLYVTQVNTNSQAFAKGIVVGDIITQINDAVIEDALVLGVFAQTVAPGDTVTLTLYRNGAQHTIEMIWGE